MQQKVKRPDGRQADQLRPIHITPGIFEFAPGSVLLEVGKTKVLCAATVQRGVPQFLRGKNTGWLTAEYALLPAATEQRTQRESFVGRKNGRSVEISRFIGRALRAVTDLSHFGERTIVLDCDVLQADAGTRTTAITGAYLALQMAQDYWLQENGMTIPFLREAIAAISVGLVNNQPVLDLCYQEDTIAQADFNFVITESNKIIEIQGGAEQEPIAWDMFDRIRTLAISGVQQVFAQIKNRPLQKNSEQKKQRKAPLFSLQNRFYTSSSS